MKPFFKIKLNIALGSLLLTQTILADHMLAYNLLQNRTNKKNRLLIVLNQAATYRLIGTTKINARE